PRALRQDGGVEAEGDGAVLDRACWWALRAGCRLELVGAPPGGLRRARLELDGRVVRRGRPALRPSARPLQPDRRPPELPPSKGLAGRRPPRRDAAREDPLRDGTPAALLHAGRGRADGAARAELE